MNERIKELAEQAGFHVAPYEGINDNNMIKKFAELIIRECIDLVSNVKCGYKDYRSQIEEEMRDDCVEALKYKYGLEDDNEFYCPSCGIKNPTTSCGLPNCGLISGEE